MISSILSFRTPECPQFHWYWQCLEKSALGGVLAPFSIAKMLIAKAWSKVSNLLTLKGV